MTGKEYALQERRPISGLENCQDRQKTDYEAKRDFNKQQTLMKAIMKALKQGMQVHQICCQMYS